MGAAHKQKKRIAPRFRFSDKDKEVVRFINSRHSRIMSTVIIDISETGIGFLVPARLAPRIGEIIKMDFAPLGSVRMACQGIVIHMEAPPNNTGWGRFPGTVKVGVQFWDMPRAYSKALSELLEGAFERAGRKVENGINVSNYPERITSFIGRHQASWLRENIWSVVATVVIMAGVGYAVYFFANLDPNEVPTQQESGWATNFFEHAIKK